MKRAACDFLFWCAWLVCAVGRVVPRRVGSGIILPCAVRTSAADNSPDTQNMAGVRPFPRPGGPIFVTLAVLDEGVEIFLYLARR